MKKIKGIILLISTKVTRYKLSVREKEVLQLAAYGLANKQVAQKINLSVDTIDTHNRNITEKLKAKNMKEAIAIGIRKGLIK